MACFLVSAAEAAVVTAVQKHTEKAEGKEQSEERSKESGSRLPLSVKLKWLSNMLWGGAILLAFEHVWHGEVTLWFPFLTAMSDQADRMQMLREMGTVGVCMAALITAVWVGMCVTADVMTKRMAEDPEPEKLRRRIRR